MGRTILNIFPPIFFLKINTRREQKMNKELLILDEGHTGLYKLDKIINTKDFASKLSIDEINMYGGFPYGTISLRYEKTETNENIDWLIARQKVKKVVGYDTRMNETGIKMEETTIPSILFQIRENVSGGTIELVEAYMFDQSHEYLQLNQGEKYNLYYLPLPNVYGNNKLCTGSMNTRNITSCINSFYTTNFNGDLWDEVVGKLGQEKINEINDGNTPDMDNRTERARLFFKILEKTQTFNESQWVKQAELTTPESTVTIGGGSQWNPIVRAH